MRDANESGVGGVQVFLDLDHDGTPDADEPRTLVSTGGDYFFGAVPPGSYQVRLVDQPIWKGTTGTSVTITTTEAATADIAAVHPADIVAPTLVRTRTDLETVKSAVEFRFSEATTAPQAQDVSIINTLTGAAMDVSLFTLSYDAGWHRLTLGFDPRQIPDGRYRISIAAASVADAAGHTLASPAVASLVVFRGDANGDGTVNFSDLVILAQNYNQIGRTFSQGNFDYSADGKVEFADLVLLAQRYNTSLLLPASLTASVKTKTRSTAASRVL
jgi:hypothetical protein